MSAENTGATSGIERPAKDQEIGYKGVESTELVFDGYRRRQIASLVVEDRAEQRVLANDGCA